MKFTVHLREQTGKGVNRKLRREGYSPGVVYGKDEPVLVTMRSDKAFRFVQAMKGAKKVFDLVIESKSGTEEKMVIIQDWQLSNFANKLIHADFFEVTKETQLSIEVPLYLINEEDCPATEEGGVIQVIRRTVPVRCAVKDIPESIVVDVKDLQFGDSIHVLDLDYPEGATPIVTGRNFTVITVAGRIEEELPEEEEELEAIEGAEGEEESESAEEGGEEQE